MIMLKENIITFHLTKNILFIVVNASILLFEVTRLNFICRIKNVYTLSNSEQLAISICESNPTSLVYVVQEQGNTNVIAVEQYKVNEHNGVVVSRSRTTVISHFDKVSQIAFANKLSNTYLMCTSKYENKLHIYNINDNSLVCCIYLGKHIMNLDNFIWDCKMELFGFVVDNEELYLYTIHENGKKCYEVCKCFEHDDNGIVKRRKGSFLGEYFNKMFSNEDTPFAHVKLNGGVKECLGAVAFDKKNESRIMCISKVNGVVRFVKVSKQNKNDVKLENDKKVKLFYIKDK